MYKRQVLAIALFAVVYVIAELMPLATWLGSETAALWVEFALFLVPYLIAGYDVLLRAAKNIGHGQVFDENFLMSVATIDVYKRQGVAVPGPVEYALAAGNAGHRVVEITSPAGFVMPDPAAAARHGVSFDAAVLALSLIHIFP